MADAQTLGLLEDRAAISDTVARYVDGVDRRDPKVVESCLAVEFHAHYGPLHFEDGSMLLEFLSRDERISESTHMLGNQYIHVDGDTATADTYAVVTQHGRLPDGTPFQLNMTGCRYVDKLRRNDGRWLITHRGGEPTWCSDDLAGVTADDPALQWLLDRAQLYDTRMSYALGIDLHDFERFRDVFAPEFAVRFGPTMMYDDIEKFIEFIRTTRVHFLSTQHFFGNQLVEISGDSARLQTYAMITHRELKEDAVEVNTGANVPGYLDVATRVDGGWRVAEAGGVEPPSGTGDAVPSTPEPRVAALVDRVQIHDVLIRCAVGIDRRDRAIVQECFADGVAATVGDHTFADSGALVDHVLTDAQQQGGTMHFTGNKLLALDGDSARCETYVYVSHKDVPDFQYIADWAAHPMRWRDHLVRRDGGWVIDEREVVTLGS